MTPFDITFNTGRLYTKEGQVIRAVETGDTIQFADFSRMIYGEIPSSGTFEGPDDFIQYVMRAYDYGHYHMVVPTLERDPNQPVRRRTL